MIAVPDRGTRNRSPGRFKMNAVLGGGVISQVGELAVIHVEAGGVGDQVADISRVPGVRAIRRRTPRRTWAS